MFASRDEETAETIPLRFLEVRNSKPPTLPPPKKIDENKLDKSSGLINLLKTSINKSSVNWVSTGMVDDYNKKLRKTLALFDGAHKKSKKVCKKD